MTNKLTSAPTKLIPNNAYLHSKDEQLFISLLLLQTLISSESYLNTKDDLHVPLQPAFLISL